MYTGHPFLALSLIKGYLLLKINIFIATGSLFCLSTTICHFLILFHRSCAQLVEWATLMPWVTQHEMATNIYQIKQ